MVNRLRRSIDDDAPGGAVDWLQRLHPVARVNLDLLVEKTVEADTLGHKNGQQRNDKEQQ